MAVSLAGEMAVLLRMAARVQPVIQVLVELLGLMVIQGQRGLPAIPGATGLPALLLLGCVKHFLVGRAVLLEMAVPQEMPGLEVTRDRAALAETGVVVVALAVTAFYLPALVVQAEMLPALRVPLVLRMA